MDSYIQSPRPHPEGAGDAERKFAFLAKVGLMLSASLDYETTLKSVARLAVPFFADYCAVDLLGEDDRLHRLVSVHVDPDRLPLAEEIEMRDAEADPSTETIDDISYRALREGHTLLIERITEDLVPSSQPAEDLRRIYSTLEPLSYMAVPLMVQGKALGTLILATTGDSERHFTSDDISIAEELAARAAAVMDSARRSRAESSGIEPTALLELLLSTMPVGFAFLDTDLRFVRASEAFAAMSSLTPEEFRGRSASEALSPTVWVWIEPFIQRARDGEAILNQEISLPFPTLANQPRHRISSFYPVRGEAGEVLGIGIVILDITERKQAEIAYAGSEARYRSLISATTQLIWVTDAQATMTDWHDWHMYTGQPVKRIAGSSPTTWLLEAVHPDDRADVAQRCNNALTVGKVCEVECRLRRFDGEYLYFSLRAVPVRDEETGRITEWVGAGTNITQRKEAEAARDAALARQGRIARTLQRALLVKPPGDAFAGLEFETLYQPAYDEMLVGGDFYDAFSLDKDRVAFVVGDVSGKGLEAAAHTAELKFTLRALLRDADDPGQAVARLNTYLRETSRYEGHSLPGHLVALTVAVLSPTSDEAHFIVAGMEPPLILRGSRPPHLPFSDLQAEPIAADGLPLGVLPDWEMEHTAVRTTFGPDDLLILSTDGLTEARHDDETADFFGHQGVIDAALNAARYRSTAGGLEDIGTDIIRAAQVFAGGRLHDDVCLLIARRRADKESKAVVEPS